MPPCGLLGLLLALPVQAQQAARPDTVPQTGSQTVTVAPGVPLHVMLTQTAKMRVGAPVDAVLTEPVYVYDRLVFPKDAVVHGVVDTLDPVHGQERAQALLNGDVTPLKTPVVRFTSISWTGMPSGPVALESEARVRQTQTVKFTPQVKTSLWGKAKGMVKERYTSAKETLTGPGKKDRALEFVYNQLPYHPQRVWRGTQMVADLEQPAVVPLAPMVAEQTPPKLADVADATKLPTGVLVHARLVTPLDSDTAQRGDTATAVVTEPVLNSRGQLVLPEGAELEGKVLRVKRSKSFGRNGQLRFTFRGVRRQGEQEQTVYGNLAGAEGSEKQNLQVDAEGNVKAQPAKNRFVAPLLLAVTAAAGHDSDGGGGQQVVGANGFGVVARVVTLAVSSPNVAVGFGAYGFAKSIYFRFLTRGHAVTFPKDTQVDVQLSDR